MCRNFFKSTHLPKGGVLVLTLLTLLLCGCDNESDSSVTAGIIQMNLTTTAGETNYALVTSTLIIQGNGVYMTIDGSQSDTIQQQLAPGAYSVTLDGNWEIQRQLEGGSWESIPAELTSPNPLAFNVIAGEITNIAFIFTAGDAVIPFGDGRVDIDIIVDEEYLDTEEFHCTSHEECPQSACHLSGEKQGQCFAEETVHNVTSGEVLKALVENLNAGDEMVVHLENQEYALESITVPSEVEVTFVGEGGTVITSNGDISALASGAPLISIDASTVNFVNLNVLNPVELSRGVVFSNGSTGALTGVRIEASTAGLTAANSHIAVENSILQSENLALSIKGTSQGSVENSVLSSTQGTQVVYIHTTSSLNLRYSDIIGGTVSALYCVYNGLPQASTLRNNIILGAEISTSTYCDYLEQSGNFVGDDVYVPSWFVNPGNYDYHLSNEGIENVEQVALWQVGDPSEDIDGDAHPLSGPGYPGIDQP